MKISTKGRYALRIMLDLAVHDAGEYIALQDVADRQGLTIKYLEQIAASLSKEGYVQSVRGKFGGYRLTRKPRDYRVGDILRVTEGNLTPVADEEPRYGDTVTAAIAPFWQGLNRAIDTYVDNVTLEDLCDNYHSLNGGDYSI